MWAQLMSTLSTILCSARSAVPTVEGVRGHRSDRHTGRLEQDNRDFPGKCVVLVGESPGRRYGQAFDRGLRSSAPPSRHAGLRNAGGNCWYDSSHA